MKFLHANGREITKLSNYDFPDFDVTDCSSLLRDSISSSCDRRPEFASQLTQNNPDIRQPDINMLGMSKVKLALAGTLGLFLGVYIEDRLSITEMVSRARWR